MYDRASLRDALEALGKEAIVPIDLNCDQCGSNRFALDQIVADDSQVNCEDCGRPMGTMAHLKELMAAAVLSRSQPCPVASESVAQGRASHLSSGSPGMIQPEQPE